jgi:uncharacterized phage protein (TIGR01671 family)
MIEIKFRAWDLIGKNMMPEIRNLQLPHKKEYGTVLMQYTGLQDLKNQDIYERDIVTFRCPHCIQEHRGEILWMDDLACWGIRDEVSDNASPLVVPVDYQDISKGIGAIKIERVIGNMYENPELLNY